MNKNYVIAALSLLAASVAQADSQRCKEVDAYLFQGDDLPKASFQVDERKLTYADAHFGYGLPKGMDDQAVAYANYGTGPSADKLDDYSVATAFGMIADGSEGGEFSVYRFTGGKHKLTYFTSYPGGNPYGLIFDGETTKVIAEIQDGDFICKE